MPAMASAAAPARPEIGSSNRPSGAMYLTASVTAAKAAGGINQVASVDHTAKNILGIIGEWCTVVKGS